MIVATALSFDMIIPGMSTLVSKILHASDVLVKLLTNLTNVLLRSITIFLVSKYLWLPARVLNLNRAQNVKVPQQKVTELRLRIDFEGYRQSYSEGYRRINISKTWR